MSLKRKIISAIISTFAVIAFTTFVSAQDADKAQQDSTQKREKRERGFGQKRGFGDKRGMRGGGIMRGFKQLNLTEAQKQQIHSILEANKPDKSSFEAIRPLMEAKRNGTLTEEQKQQLESFRAQQKQKHDLVRQQVLGVLTTEQVAQLEKMKEEMKQKREERKQMRQERKNQQVPPTEKKDN